MDKQPEEQEMEQWQTISFRALWNGLTVVERGNLLDAWRSSMEADYRGETLMEWYRRAGPHPKLLGVPAHR